MFEVSHVFLEQQQQKLKQRKSRNATLDNEKLKTKAKTQQKHKQLNQTTMNYNKQLKHRSKVDN